MTQLKQLESQRCWRTAGRDFKRELTRPRTCCCCATSCLRVGLRGSSGRRIGPLTTQPIARGAIQESSRTMAVFIEIERITQSDDHADYRFSLVDGRNGLLRFDRKTGESRLLTPMSGDEPPHCYERGHSGRNRVQLHTSDFIDQIGVRAGTA